MRSEIKNASLDRNRIDENTLVEPTRDVARTVVSTPHFEGNSQAQPTTTAYSSQLATDRSANVVYSWPATASNVNVSSQPEAGMAANVEAAIAVNVELQPTTVAEISTAPTTVEVLQADAAAVLHQAWLEGAAALKSRTYNEVNNGDQQYDNQDNCEAAALNAILEAYNEVFPVYKSERYVEEGWESPGWQEWGIVSSDEMLDEEENLKELEGFITPVIKRGSRTYKGSAESVGKMIQSLRSGPITRAQSRNKLFNTEIAGSEDNDSVDMYGFDVSEDKMGCELDKAYYADGVISHVSGMMFDPDDERYSTWVTNDDEDLELFYVPNIYGEFKLAIKGEMGKNNKKILNMDDWDKNSIFSEASHGYRPYLLQIFKSKFKEIKEKRKRKK